MGVRRLFSSLVDRYPYLVSNAKEASSRVKRPQLSSPHLSGLRLQESSDHTTKLATQPYLNPNHLSEANPNGCEFHNFYIDLNGIIHQSYIPFAGKNQSPEETLTNEEIFENVAEGIERLVNLVRPRILLYIAIDGSAPLAKQQQQRQRRFFQAKSLKDKQAMYENLKKEVEEKNLNIEIPPLREGFDSNLISPGTEFLADLGVYLRKFIEKKLSSREWKFRVIFSDSQVPGEGEHKIIRFIKSQIENAGSSLIPNTKHVIYGLDADLIFLALSLHEPHTTILRESVGGAEQKRHILDPKLSFRFLHIHTLREYLAREFCLPNAPFQPNFERIVNDVIFFSIFLGNDFLPPLPTLDISKGAIDILFSAYREQLGELFDHGYLVKEDCANFNPLALKSFLLRVKSLSERGFLKHTKASHETREARQQRTGKKNSSAPSIKIINKQSFRINRACKHYGTPKGCSRRPCPYIHVDVEKLLREEPTQAEVNSPLLSQPDESSTTRSESETSSVSNDDLKEIDIYPREQEIFVGNLPKDITADHLRSIFECCGEILRAEIVVNPFSNKSKGFGFITFDSEDSALAAVERFVDAIKIDGSLVRVTPAKKQNESQSDRPVSQKEFLSELEYRLKEEEKRAVREFELPFGFIDQSLSDEEMLKNWKRRYYEYNCDIIDSSDRGFSSAVSKMTKSYIDGLHFVLQYYLLDVPSWSYHYTYYEAPFADDIAEHVELYSNLLQDDSKPFRPIDQLMSILPISSSKGLPEPYREIQRTTLLSYFPDEFYIDFDCRMHWEGIPILPMIDRKVFEAAIQQIDESRLSETEKKRNEFHLTSLYVPKAESAIPFSLSFCSSISSDQSSSPVFDSYSIDFRPPKSIVTSLLSNVLPTDWAVEKKAKFIFKIQENHGVEIQLLRDQLAQLQLKIEELKAKDNSKE